jgi:hypothetical protein
MIKPLVVVLLAAVLLAAMSAGADPASRTAPAAPVSAESQESGRDQPAQHAGSGSFKRDVKQAWADAGAGFRKAGHAIGDGARSFGRSTRDAAVGGWRAVKDAFSN